MAVSEAAQDRLLDGPDGIRGWGGKRLPLLRQAVAVFRVRPLVNLLDLHFGKERVTQIKNPLGIRHAQFAVDQVEIELAARQP